MNGYSKLESHVVMADTAKSVCGIRDIISEVRIVDIKRVGESARILPIHVKEGVIFKSEN